MEVEMHKMFMIHSIIRYFSITITLEFDRKS